MAMPREAILPVVARCTSSSHTLFNPHDAVIEKTRGDEW
jgi:hypothetical protein